MIPANLIQWVQGHIEQVNKSIEGPLMELAKAHGEAEVETELMHAVFALNRAVSILAYRHKSPKPGAEGPLNFEA